MKHTLKITMILVLIFLITQVFGLVTVSKYIKVGETLDGKPMINHSETVLGKPPQVENKSSSFVMIMGAVLFGTALLLAIIRFKLGKLWKVWFFLAIWITITVTLGVYINSYFAALVAFLIGLSRLFRPNVFVHNISEVFIYTGIGLVFLPVLNLFSTFILLFFISIYDMIAVWQSKHMVKMAKYQAKQRMFAGLNIPYSLPKKKGKGKKESKVKSAILGGGDIAFPLLFSATVLEFLILNQEFSKWVALLYTLIISLTTAIALLVLLIKAKKDKFYPAMPFISAGCYAGFGVVYLLTLI